MLSSSAARAACEVQTWGRALGRWPNILQVLLRFPADPKGGEDTGGKKVEAPSHFDPPNADAFGDRDVNCDQEDICHGKFADDRKGRHRAGAKQVELDQGDADGFEHWGHQRKKGNHQREEYVRRPKRLQAAENRDFGESEKRQQTRAQQWCGPGDGVEDYERQVQGAQHGRCLGQAAPARHLIFAICWAQIGAFGEDI